MPMFVWLPLVIVGAILFVAWVVCVAALASDF